MAIAPKAAKAANYVITAVQVRQNVATLLERPYVPPGDPDPWADMTRAERAAFMLEKIQTAQNAAMQMGHETTHFWADQIQWNAGYMIDAIAAVEARGFFTRQVNNNLDGYDELEISARPFPVVV